MRCDCNFLPVRWSCIITLIAKVRGLLLISHEEGYSTCFARLRSRIPREVACALRDVETEEVS